MHLKNPRKHASSTSSAVSSRGPEFDRSSAISASTQRLCRAMSGLRRSDSAVTSTRPGSRPIERMISSSFRRRVRDASERTPRSVSKKCPAPWHSQRHAKIDRCFMSHRREPTSIYHLETERRNLLSQAAKKERARVTTGTVERVGWTSFTLSNCSATQRSYGNDKSKSHRVWIARIKHVIILTRICINPKRTCRIDRSYQTRISRRAVDRGYSQVSLRLLLVTHGAKQCR